MARVLILLLFLVPLAQSQPSILVSLGGTAPFSVVRWPHNRFAQSEYWDVGLTGNLVFQYRLVKWLYVSTSVDHDLYPSQRSPDQIWTERLGEKALSYTGSPSQLTRLTLGLTVIHDTESMHPKPFFGAGVGYEFVRYGHEEVVWGDLQGQYLSSNSYDLKGETSWQVWMKSGAVFQITQFVAIIPALELRYALEEWAVGHRSYGLASLRVAYTVWQ